MTKRELVRKRNWFKHQLLGIHLNNTDRDILSEFETTRIRHITSLIEEMIINFDDTSRELGLKVPKYRCWCGKEGKYKASDRCRELGYIKVCYKHRNDE